MRPVMHKARKAEDHVVEEDSEVETVKETQLADAPTLRIRRRKAGTAAVGSAASSDDDAASEYEDAVAVSSDKASEASKPGKPAKAGQSGSKATNMMAVAAESKEAEEKSEKKKPPKMVSAQAHANFRALKIKNKNSKAGKGGKRFGRR